MQPALLLLLPRAPGVTAVACRLDPEERGLALFKAALAAIRSAEQRHAGVKEKRTGKEA
jgi:hypothetical protein